MKKWTIAAPILRSSWVIKTDIKQISTQMNISQEAELSAVEEDCLRRWPGMPVKEISEQVTFNLEPDDE